MRNSIIVSIIFIVTIFTGCESSDIVSLPHQAQRLVVNSLGYAGYPLHAKVTLSQDALYSGTYKDFEDAKVNLYENGVLAEQLIYTTADVELDTTLGLFLGGTSYAGTLIPKPGNVYKITVEHPDFPTLESEYKQPDVVEVKSAEITGTGSKPGVGVGGVGSGFQISATIGFDDPAGENFYEISATANYGNMHGASNLFLTFVDPAYKQFDDIYYPVTAFDDTNFNGQSVELQFIGTYIDFGRDIASFTVFIRNISKEYYEYLKASTIQRKNAEDPFAQPILIPDNIINGYGLFGGFTESSMTVENKK